MTVERWLWIVFAINTAFYIWAGWATIIQPQWNRPRILGNPAMLLLAGVGPPLCYTAIIILGFLLTDGGWYLLLTSIGVYALFAIMPGFFE